MEVVAIVSVAARAIAVALVAMAGVVGLTHWAVRRRYLDPFGAWSRGMRRLSDPVLRPIERRLVRSGGNPQDGTLWLLGVAVVAGLLVIGLTRWILGFVFSLLQLTSAGPMVWIKTVAGWAIAIVMMALLVRVVAQWIGASPFSRFMQLVTRLTDWIILPIRRRVPALGPIDVSPILAYFALFLLRELVWALPGGR
ncbi:MAG: YggT family protein [Gemmatimonadales bacterium]